jgi:hypothetical protein
MFDDLMSEKEVAQLLRQPLMKIQEWRRIGFMPPHHRLAFKCVVYRKADVTAWLEARRVEPVYSPRHQDQEDARPPSRAA